jgi:hypothetical protein
MARCATQSNLQGGTQTLKCCAAGYAPRLVPVHVAAASARGGCPSPATVMAQRQVLELLLPLEDSLSPRIDMLEMPETIESGEASHLKMLEQTTRPMTQLCCQLSSTLE